MSSIGNIGATPVALVTPQATAAPAAPATTATPAHAAPAQAAAPLVVSASLLTLAAQAGGFSADEVAHPWLLVDAVIQYSDDRAKERGYPTGVGSFEDGSTTDVTGTNDTPEGAIFGGNDQTINVSGTYAHVLTNGNRNHISVAASGSVGRLNAAGGDHETVDIAGHVQILSVAGNLKDPGGGLVTISGSVNSLGFDLEKSTANISGHVNYLKLSGTGDVVNITGTADEIKVTGDNDKILVPVGFKGKINITGNNDQIIIVDADGKPVITDTVGDSSRTSQTSAQVTNIQTKSAAAKAGAAPALSKQDVAAELALDVIIKAQAAYEQSVKTKPGTSKSDNPENYAIANALAPSTNDRKSNSDSASKKDTVSALPTQV